MRFKDRGSAIPSLFMLKVITKILAIPLIINLSFKLASSLRCRFSLLEVKPSLDLAGRKIYPALDRVSFSPLNTIRAGRYSMDTCSVARLTFTSETPGRENSFFSTLETQDAQVIPSIEKVSCTEGTSNPSFLISSGNCSALIFSGSNSTVAISAAKLTLAKETPSNSPTFFSIRAEQLAQLMPFTGRAIVSFFSEITSRIVNRVNLFIPNQSTPFNSMSLLTIYKTYFAKGKI